MIRLKSRRRADYFKFARHRRSQPGDQGEPELLFLHPAEGCLHSAQARAAAPRV
jgi:hypothetical protein